MSTRELINEYLLSRGIEAPEGPNAKIDDDLAEEIIQYFDPVPDQKEDSVADIESISDNKPVEEVAIEPEETTAPEPEVDEEETLVEEEKPEEKIAARPEEDESLEDFVARQKVDVIKVKKVKLEGVKVLGKIDLPQKPEPKSEEEKKEESSDKPVEEKPKGLYGDYLEKKNRRHKTQKTKSEKETAFLYRKAKN